MNENFSSQILASEWNFKILQSSKFLFLKLAKFKFHPSFNNAYPTQAIIRQILIQKDENEKNFTYIING